MKTKTCELTMEWNGTHILFDAETGMGNITAMWKACGGEKRNEPANWLRTKDVKRFIEELCKDVNLQVSELVIVKRGVKGGTWAHWQIATAYAYHLNPAFAIAWNKFARSYLEQKNSLPQLTEAEQHRIQSAEMRKSFTAAIQPAAANAPWLYAAITNHMYRELTDHDAKGLRQMCGTKNPRDQFNQMFLSVIGTIETTATEIINRRTIVERKEMVEVVKSLAREHRSVLERAGISCDVVANVFADETLRLAVVRRKEKKLAAQARPALPDTQQARMFDDDEQ